MKRLFIITLLLIAFQVTLKAAANRAMAPKEDIEYADSAMVTIFVPGIIPTTADQNAAPAFAPDGKSVYFGQRQQHGVLTIMVSQHKAGKWSAPTIASFSGHYLNLEPAFSPDGKYLIFASSRPVGTDTAKIDGRYNGKVYPGKGGNLWKVSLSKKGWSEPERLPDIINSNTSVFSPAVTADGSLYFMRADSGGRFHIYRSQMKDGQYQTPVQESFSMDQYGDYDPVVAPDESFMIFSSGRPPAPHMTDLFIVVRTPNGWGEAVDLRSVVSQNVFGVEARCSPDFKTLYFSNSRNPGGVIEPTKQFIWKVDIRSLLKSNRVL